MAYSGPYGPPQVDFGALDPIGSYQKGAEVRRAYELRKGLSKIAPDDFQGMARLLAQFGDPKDAVNMMQLQNQLQHQTFQERLATEQLGATREVQKSLIETRGQRSQLQFEEKAAPYHALQSGIPTYATARDSVMDAPGGAGLRSVLGAGGPIDQIRAFAVTVGEALHKKDPKAYAASVTPTGSDLFGGTAAGKFAQLEQDAATAREMGSSTFDLAIPEIPAYVKKPAPPAPQAGHAAPNALRAAASPSPAGAVPPPVTVSPPGLNQEGAAAAEVLPHTVRTIPQIAKGSPQETEALRQARDNIAAHPNDTEYAKRIIQKLLSMGIEPDRIGMGQQ